MAADNRTIKELSASGLDNAAPLCIQYPMAALGKTDEFELKSSLLHHIPKFHGMSMEDPNKHLKEFKVVCSSMTPMNVDGSILKMKMAEGIRMKEPNVCGVCSIQGHVSDKCLQLIENGGWESANAIGFQGQNQPKNDPYSNTYNPGTSLDNETPLKLLTNLSHGQENQAKAMQNQEKRVDQMENQIGQIAEFVRQFREQGKLPSSTVINPNGGFEFAKAISLRSGKQVGSDPQPSNSRSNEVEKLIIEEKEQSTPTKIVETPLPRAPKAPKPSNSANKGKEVPSLINSNVVPPNVPFPRRFMQLKNEEAEKDILETFRKVQVNIPLLDAIKQVPRYAKFLKELCITRKRISSKEVVKVSENVSAVLQRKLPTKCKDLGSFTIPCVIGNTHFESAMLDLGASINIMPYSIYASMHLGELKNDNVIIQLADHSNAYPKGVLEDVLVQVNHLIFLADFYVLEMDESDHSLTLPILLGRPFMKTAQTKIDVAKGSVTMAFGGDMISFNIPEFVENTNDVLFCCAIDVIENIGQKRSTLIKKKVPRTTIEEEIGVNNKECTTTPLKTPILTKSNPCAFVDSAATSLQHIRTSPNPISIPISTNRLLPSMVQVPNRMQGSRKGYIDCWKQQTKIRKDYYPVPFKDSMCEHFKEHVVENVSLHAVGPVQA
ncbi:unnamed protein product [Malus baccata var. baccata]